MQVFHRSTNTFARLSIFGSIFVIAAATWALNEINRSSWVTQAQVAREQPVPFSHKHHAGELGIDCRYCHNFVERSKYAGVPPTQTCMNCHQMVDSTNRPELEKLKKYYADNEPIPWVKVHDLPDFVYFSHKRHVLGGVKCQECHGEVQDIMTVDRRVNTLEMGWCLNCHATHPKVDENYGAQAELRRAELKDCWTCHK